jgi:hypothetical protein
MMVLGGVLPSITLSENDKNGRRQREHNRARAFQISTAFSTVHTVRCRAKARAQAGTRELWSRGRVHLPGGDKAITEL